VGHATAAKGSNRNTVSVLSFMDFLFSMGSVATPLLVNRFTASGEGASSGWRAVFLVAAVLLAVAMGLATRLGQNTSPSSEKSSVSSAGYLSLLAHPIFFIFMVGCLFLHATEWGHGVWFVTYAHEAVGLRPEQAREAFSFFLVGMATSRLLNSWLIWIFRSTTVMAILVSSATVAAISIPGYQSYSALCVLNFMFGFGLGSLFPLLLGLSMERAPTKSAMLSGIGLMAGTLGAKTISYVIGFFADQTSLAESYRYVSWTMAALLVCVLGFLSLYIQMQRSRTVAAAPEDSPRDAPAGGLEGAPRPALLESGGPPEARFEFSFGLSRRVLGGLASRLLGYEQFLGPMNRKLPLPALSARNSFRRLLLDLDLQREFVALFGEKRLLEREEASRFLSLVWDKYPLAREFYPSPQELLASADQHPVLSAEGPCLAAHPADHPQGLGLEPGGLPS
jgi:MFS transporter, DHA1 family, inner membrane transport protein